MRIGSGGGWLVVAAAVLAIGALPTPARAQAAGDHTSAMDGQWHFSVAPYMWFSGIKGELSVGRAPAVPVDIPISDILSNFDFGLEGHFQARKDRVGLIFDFIYTNLGVPVLSEAELLDFNVDIRQFISEGLVFYRVASGGNTANPATLDLLAGARYTGTKGRLQAERSGVEYDGEFEKLSWVDGLAGFKFRAPLGSKVSILGRADIAGFGSQLTYNLEGDLVTRVSHHWFLGVGWRYMDIEYEEGEGSSRRYFDLAYNGARVWAAYSW